MPTGRDTASAPLEVPRAWMRTRTKTSSPRSRTSSISRVAARPAPSKKFSRAVRIPAKPLRVPPLDRVFWVDQLDGRVHQLFEPCHHSVHGLAAVDHLERSAHKLLVRPSHELSILASAFAWKEHPATALARYPLLRKIDQNGRPRPGLAGVASARQCPVATWA